MRDEDLVSRMEELDAQGPTGLQAMRDLLRQEGGMSRCIGIMRRAYPKKRATGKAADLTPFPDDFPDSAAKEAAKAYWSKNGRPDLIADVDGVATAFAGFHRGRGSRQKDWRATWQTWYAREVSIRPKREPGLFVAASGGGKAFEPTNLDGWIGRLEIFHGLKEGIAAGRWQEEWGGRPGSPECKVPPEATRRVQAALQARSA